MDNDKDKDLSEDIDFEIVSSDDDTDDGQKTASADTLVTPPPPASQTSSVSGAAMELESTSFSMDDDDMSADDMTSRPVATGTTPSDFDLDDDEGLEEISGVESMNADTDFSDLDALDDTDDDFTNDLADYSDYDLSGGGDGLDDDLEDMNDEIDIGIGGADPSDDDSDAFFAARPGGDAFASSAQSKVKSGGSRSRLLLLILLLVVVVGGGGLYFMSATATPGIQMPPPVQAPQVAQMGEDPAMADPNAPINPNEPFADTAMADPNAVVDPNAMVDPNAIVDPNAAIDPNQAQDPFADPAQQTADPFAVDAQDPALAAAEMPQEQDAAMQPDMAAVSPEPAPAPVEVDPFTGQPIAPAPDPSVVDQTIAADPLAEGMAALDNAVADLEAQTAAVDPATTVDPALTVAPPQAELIDPNTPVVAPEIVPSETGEVAMTPTPDEMAAAANAGTPLPMPSNAANAVFFDSAREARVAENSPQEQGPELVNPRNSPASRFVVVENVVSADNQESEQIAAQRALALGRYDAALGFYESMYRKNPRDPRILMGYALSLQKTGRPDEAIDKYDELLQIAPDNTEALVNAMGLIQQQNPQAAINALQELRAKNPGNAGVAAQLGIAYASSGNYAEARRYLGIATSLDPKNAMNFYNLGNVAERMGQRQEAVRNYEKALEIDAIYGGGRSIPRDTIYDRLALLR